MLRDPRVRRLMVAARWILALGLVASFSGRRPGMPPPVAWAIALLLVHGIDRVATDARPMDFVRAHRFSFALALVALLGLAIRLAGIGGDLGRSPVDMDENRLARSVLGFFERGEVNHETAENYPGIAYWLLAAADLLAYLIALMGGVAGRLSNVPFELFLLADRAANAVVGSLTIVFVGLAAATLGGAVAGIVAALAFAVCPLAVDISTQLRNEATQVALVSAAALASVRLVATPRRDPSIAALAGCLAGAAAAVKYTSVFALLPVLVAASAPGDDDSLGRTAKRLGVAVLAFVAAIAITNHFLWADFPSFVRHLSGEVAHSSAERHWASQKDPLWFYTKTLGRYGPGWMLLILASAFAVCGLASRSLSAVVLLAFALPYMWFMTHQSVQFRRWVYPLAPFVAIAGAAALSAAVDRARSSRQSRLVIAALVAATLAQPLSGGALVFSQRVATPTYGRAEAWLGEHAAPGDRVLAENGWLRLEKTSLEVNRVPLLRLMIDGGIYPLAYNDWVVVHEADMKRHALERLRPAATFLAENSFGGAAGFDLAIYAVPKPAPVDAIEIDLSSPAAKDYLGPEWLPAEAGRRGRRVRPEGASLYVPRLTSGSAKLELDIEAEEAAGGEPLVVLVESDPLPATSVAKAGAELHWRSTPFALPANEAVWAVRITPRAEIRVLRFAICP